MVLAGDIRGHRSDVDRGPAGEILKLAACFVRGAAKLFHQHSPRKIYDRSGGRLSADDVEFVPLTRDYFLKSGEGGVC
jgi:hypothetical protein